MKQALCIGINYHKTDFELRGCLNDAADWMAALKLRHFNVTSLLEKDATRHNILDGLQKLITSLSAGDVGFVTYSGHGTWVPDTDGDEPDGRDEAICPVDMGNDGRNLILDDDFHKLFAKLHADAHVVFVTDSCHSGTVFRFAPLPSAKRRVRFLPPAHFISAPKMEACMLREFGQPSRKANTPLPGVIHFSGCKDNEYSTDAEIVNRPCGAMTHYALQGFDAAEKKGGTYLDAWKAIRVHLPSAEYPQTPLLTAPVPLKRLAVFT